MIFTNCLIFYSSELSCFILQFLKVMMISSYYWSWRNWTKDQKFLHAFPKRHLVRKGCLNMLDFLRRTQGRQSAVKSQVQNSVIEPRSQPFLTPLGVNFTTELSFLLPVSIHCSWPGIALMPLKVLTRSQQKYHHYSYVAEGTWLLSLDCILPVWPWISHLTSPWSFPYPSSILLTQMWRFKGSLLSLSWCL